MTPPPPDARRTVTYAVTLTLGGIVLLYTLYLVRQVLLLLYIAGLLAIGLSPAVRWLERHLTGQKRRRLPRWAAILVVYVVLTGAVVATFSIVIPPLVTQAGELWAKLPTYADDLQRTLVRYRLITHRYTWSEVLKTVPSPGLAVAGVLGAVQGVLGVIGAIVTILVLPYYLLLESHSLNGAFQTLFPYERRPRVARITRNVTVKVSAWLLGQVLLSFVIGTTAGLGLWLLGVPYFYVLAVVAAVGELIPVVGPIMAAIPGILVALTVSMEVGLFTAAYFGIQQFVENHFLVPRIMERQVGVSAVTVIASLLIGSELLGIVGALLAVPTAAIAQVLFQEFIESKEKTA